MHRLNIKKCGTIFEGQSAVSGNPLRFSGSAVSLEPSFTLASYFLMLNAYPELQQLSEMIPALMEIAGPHLEHPEKEETLTGLVFFKTIEIKGDKLPPELTLYNQVKGKDDHGLKNLKFFHIETLLGHHLSLAPLEHIVFGDTQDTLQFDTFYSLFEFVESIAWQLSFNFNPLQCSIRR